MSIKQDLIDLEKIENDRIEQMGEENYYKWLESKFKVFICKLGTLECLKQTLEKAGYDFVEINTGNNIYLNLYIFQLIHNLLQETRTKELYHFLQIFFLTLITIVKLLSIILINPLLI